MNKISLAFITLVSLFFTIAIHAQEQFEGRIQLVQSGSMEFDADFFIKGQRVSVETDDFTPGKLVRFLSNGATGELYLIGDTNGKLNAMKIDPTKMNLAAFGLKSNETESFDIVLEKTEEQKEISGFNCNKVLIKGNTMKGEAWVSKEPGLIFSDLFPVLKDVLNTPQLALMKAEALDGMILQANYTTLKDGSNYVIEMDMQAMEVAEELLVLPEGIKVLDMTLFNQDK